MTPDQAKAFLWFYSQHEHELEESYERWLAARLAELRDEARELVDGE